MLKHRVVMNLGKVCEISDESCTLCWRCILRFEETSLDWMFAAVKMISLFAPCDSYRWYSCWSSVLLLKIVDPWLLWPLVPLLLLVQREPSVWMWRSLKILVELVGWRSAESRISLERCFVVSISTPPKITFKLRP